MEFGLQNGTKMMVIQQITIYHVKMMNRGIGLIRRLIIGNGEVMIITREHNLAGVRKKLAIPHLLIILPCGIVLGGVGLRLLSDNKKY